MKLKRNKPCMVLTLSAFIIILSGCASIVSKSLYPVNISSQPSGATISITNSKGIEIFNGNTPANVNLKAGEGFFKKASYEVKFSKDGYDEKMAQINFKLDGWYFGNIVFGGLIGLLIVDPITGAMYKLDTEFLNETLSQSTASTDSSGLKILDINQISSDWKDHLVLLSK